jgi:hypothetical protein
MQKLGARFIFSPSDLSRFLECSYVTQLGASVEYKFQKPPAPGDRCSERQGEG